MNKDVGVLIVAISITHLYIFTRTITQNQSNGGFSLKDKTILGI